MVQNATDFADKVGQFRYQLIAGALLVLPVTINPYQNNIFEAPKAFVAAAVSGCILITFVLVRQAPSITRFTVLFAGFIGLVVVSTWYSENHQLSLWGLNDRHGVITLISLLMIAFGIGNSVANSAQHKLLAECIAFSSVPVVLYAMLQIFGLDFFQWPAFWDYTNVFSTLGRGTYLSGHLAVVAPFVLYKWGLLEGGLKKSIVTLYCFALAIVVLMTNARAGMLALVIGCSVFLLLTLKKPRQFLMWLIGISIVTIAVVTMFINQIVAWYPNPDIFLLRTSTLGFRYINWLATLRFTTQLPLTGIGEQMYMVHYPPFFAELYPEMIGQVMVATNPHNIFLSIAIAFGLPALIIFFMLLYSVVKMLGQIVIAANQKADKVLYAACLAGLGAYLIQASFNPDSIATQAIFWVIVGIAYSLHLSTTKQAPL